MKGLILRALETNEILEMIYLSERGEISQRKIKIISFANETVTAFCFMRNKPRVFKLSNILSIMPIKYKKGA